MGPWTLIPLEKGAAVKLGRRGALFLPFVISCSLSPFVYTFLRLEMYRLT